MTTSDLRATARRRLTGLLALAVPLLLVWLSIAFYHKDFTHTDTVTVLTDSTGNEMHVHADVKLRGVVVGEVSKISANGSRASLTLAMQPGKMRQIPSGVSAQMLPTTLFGERYVALVPNSGAGGGMQTAADRADGTVADPLRAGATIDQDRSHNAIELQQVLDHTLPLLTAVKPEKLSATLTAVSQALDGRGAELGASADTLAAYLKKLNPDLPLLTADIRRLATVSGVYADAAPDLLAGLENLTKTSATVASQRDQLATLYGSAANASTDARGFLDQNAANIIRLNAASRPSLQLMQRYSPEFPCLLKTLSDFVPNMDKALGKGTDKPGLHVSVTVTEPRGAYKPGADTPTYTASGGPACYPVPYSGVPRATAAPLAVTPLNAATARGSLGIANSPAENTLVNELLAPALHTKPTSLPDWSSVLTGPAFRGTEVSVK
ncbi:ABC transporter substrate-binding protein [Mangrovactinospora gilvigrisea]|uniref:ABC transporter substrate-binding protein n=1 Tax=Mangrovactinospora gilvigrisea TaxID=1428644 RepID=A0A1J7BBH3_9ACTN|nr:MCE family protein [Mangrovactinospora gilvigrisea]OIV36031.1 ABC transporter substrate-binding protein [Mangrovactinospora gilvigrisea]